MDIGPLGLARGIRCHLNEAWPPQLFAVRSCSARSFCRNVTLRRISCFFATREDDDSSHCFLLSSSPPKPPTRRGDISRQLSSIPLWLTQLLGTCQHVTTIHHHDAFSASTTAITASHSPVLTTTSRQRRRRSHVVATQMNGEEPDRDTGPSRLLFWRSTIFTDVSRSVLSTKMY